MTTRREVPFTGDTLAWVHNELAEIKSRLNLIQQAAEQSRALSMEAADRSSQARAKVDGLDGHEASILHLQDDMRAIRELVARTQDDIHSLRQSREEVERRILADSERTRQERNEISHRFDDVERLMEGWHERASSYEEHNRRNLEGNSLLVQRIEVLENQISDIDTLQSRSQSTLSRVDQEVQRLSTTLNALEREDHVLGERTNTAFEMLRRIETELEALKTETNKIIRIDDRLELVQAERTRHNERLNELGLDLSRVQEALEDHAERISLVEVRISGYQDELRGLRGTLLDDRDRISSYLHSLTELESDMRKRHIAALEKEIRDLRGRAIHFAEE